MRTPRLLGVLATGLGLGLAAVILLVGTSPGRRLLVNALNPTYAAPALAPLTDAPVGSFDGVDLTRPQQETRLVPVAQGFAQVTDLLAVPGERLWLVAEKGGRLAWFDETTSQQGTLARFQVNDASEMGLLGVALSPNFETDSTLYISRVVRGKSAGVSQVERYTASSNDLRIATLSDPTPVLSLVQPYGNHNGGHIAFGPDAMLYVAFGDGGFRDDPHSNGQDRSTWFGTLLRIDVSAAPYAVPGDNPFVGQAGVAPEIFAYGLRNPWRFAFGPAGELIVGDVGQDRFEELDLVAPGDNLGWSVREGLHCANGTDTCESGRFKEPFLEYGREDGASITGGIVVTAAGPLQGRYVYGDFAHGRLWAVDLPTQIQPHPGPTALGHFSLLPSAFALDHTGNPVVADFASGGIFRLTPIQ